ncbi:MAG: hypothetical protein IJ730_05920, partial [Alphaproteobacteria bacterium]|nr:hypothetical protein [Alphaproteobacteria bacterium]
MKTKATMLTTVDNPFDPFTEWDDWRRFDEDHGYYTCEYLGRVCDFSYELSEADQEVAVLTAIADIVRFEPETY